MRRDLALGTGRSAATLESGFHGDRGQKPQSGGEPRELAGGPSCEVWG